MKNLRNATAFITGAGRGIGRGIARTLAAHGTRLALADLDGSGLAAVSDELSGTTDVRTFVLDVQDRKEFGRAVDEAEPQLGHVTVLCNNAGLVFPEELGTMTYELWDLTLGVNLGGVVNGIQTVLPRLLQRGEPAHIVNTASVAGLGPGGGLMYTTSKYAVVGLSEALDEQLRADGIQIGVTALCPGAVTTDIAATGHAAVSGLTTSEAAQAYVDRLSRSAGELLAKHGIDPDEVGRMAVDAITAQQTFVLTDRAAEHQIDARTRRILQSLPESTESGESIYQSAAALRS